MYTGCIINFERQGRPGREAGMTEWLDQEGMSAHNCIHLALYTLACDSSFVIFGVQLTMNFFFDNNNIIIHC